MATKIHMRRYLAQRSETPICGENRFCKKTYDLQLVTCKRCLRPIKLESKQEATNSDGKN